MSSTLRDVPGPSALGGGRRRTLELLVVIAASEFRRTYFNTALGYVWSICRPLLFFGVLLLVFTQVFRLGADVPFYPVLLLLNLVLFTFFQEATLGAVGSVVAQEAVVRKTQFPRLVIPLSVVLTAVFNLGPNLVVAFVFLLAFGVAPAWTWLLLPVALLALLGITTAVATILAGLFPRFRDVALIWSVAVTALMYASPVLYPLTAVSDGLRTVLSFNPLSPIFGLVRRWVVDPSAPGPAELAGGRLQLLVPVAIYVLVCAFAVWVFRREAPRIAEEL